MSIRIKILLLSLSFFLITFDTKGQITFMIDSLAFSCYDSSKENSSWESKELQRRGPDVFVFGRLVNEGDSPILLELYEDVEDSLVIYKELNLYVSYQDDTNSYYFSHDPLIITDIMSYPFLAGGALPITTIEIDGKHWLLSVISASESISLAFETLSKPKTESNSKRHSQERAIKAIRSTLDIIPSVREHIGVSDEERLFREFLFERQKREILRSKYDAAEMSIPTSFLDAEPRFPEGDTLGFYGWLREQLSVIQPQFLGRERRFIMVFVVGKDGKIVYANAIKTKSEDIDLDKEDLIKEVLFKSPQWIPGELHGKSVDSRMNLFLSFDARGEVVSLSLE